MKKNLLAILLAFISCFGLNAQVLYEDFEGGPDLTWQSFNGAFNGAIANPDPDAVNNSATVGSTTNNAASSSCYNVGDLTSPMDLSEFN